MARISSTTLFNFTNKLEYLIDNLKHGIYCHFFNEKLPFNKIMYRAPMVCFCDIPLSLIQIHMKRYGEYGIGINKSFAKSKKVKPVWYIPSNNEYLKYLLTKSKHSLSFEEKQYLLPYMKQYLTKDCNNHNVKNYDEREWRYIPQRALISTYLGKKEVSRIEPEAPFDGRFLFDLSNIEYIFIKDKKELPDLIDTLEKICDNDRIKYSTLLTKVMVVKAMKKDW